MPGRSTSSLSMSIAGHAYGPSLTETVGEPRNRHERRKQMAEARRLGRQDLLRQPSATVLRSEMQARVEREWQMHSELYRQTALDHPVMTDAREQ